MDRPPPVLYQPRLTWWSHTWRLLLMLAISGLTFGETVVRLADEDARGLLVVDVVCGLLAFVLVHFRRRWPVPVAVAVTILGAVSSMAAGPAVLAAVSVATRRRWPEVITIALLGMAAGEVYFRLAPSLALAASWWLNTVINLAVTTAIFGWGMYIGSRRDLFWTMQERAERVEAEQELREAQARGTERARIAREMHDVLAHRISQISLRAGAMAFRDDLGHADLRTSAAQIQSAANAALEDLRGILGVLRDPDTGEALDRPQPTYADLPTLVEEARESGLRVQYAADLPPAPPVPDGLGRTIYRIVQEGMTNAHKHAPGAILDVSVSGSPDSGVEVRLRNALGVGNRSAGEAPGAGLGLVGLTERAALRGGRLEHGRVDGAFVLRGWLPWTA